jgi:hypothetical protein
MAEVDRLEGRFEQFEKRMVEGLAAVNTRIDDLGTRLTEGMAAMNTHIDDLGTRLTEGLAAVNTRIDDVGKRVSDLQWSVGLGLTVGFGWLTAVMAGAVAIILKYR